MRSSNPSQPRVDRAVALIVRSAIPTLLACASAFAADTADDLTGLSLEELANVEVTSVSKIAESLQIAPATIYVIGAEEIARSGATTLPEVLRLAPNLDVRQSGSSSYAVAARGFIGNPSTQSFSNKLLILIDGRSVYSPLFSGIYYDSQDVLLEDVERIEVISGPGATLWGANAMNGVINIITHRARDTQGAFASVGGGSLERDAGLRFGGAARDLAYRVYGKAFERDAFERSNGDSAEDNWRRKQAGFRLDWNPGDDMLTAQGDVYRVVENQSSANDVEIEGANALARWQHHGEHSMFQMQTYFDLVERGAPIDGAAFNVRTFDFEVQQSIEIGKRHKLVFGGGERIHRYDIDNTSTLLFLPNRRTLNIGNVFVHDSISLFARFHVILGLKLEQGPFGGWSPLPDVKLSFALDETTTLWASGARAIRSSTPFDHDVVERVGGVDFLTGNPNFEAERVDAFEIGYRGQPFSLVSFTASIFYNEYDNLRSIETATPSTFLPLRWDNFIGGSTHGLAAWAKWQLTDWWRISPGIRILRSNFEFRPGASRLLSANQNTNDPSTQASLSSSMTLPHDLTLDFFLRYVSGLPDPALDAYTEMNARIGWRPTKELEFSLNGINLLHRRHRESPILTDPEIGRSVYAEARWRF